MLKQRLIAVLLLVAGAGIGYWSYATEHGKFGGMKMHFGLDIQGGAALLYKAEIPPTMKPADIPEAMSALRDSIERRVNPNGNIEASVSTEEVTLSNGVTDHRLSVEIPGVVDLKQAVDSIGKAPLLEFKTPSADFDEIEKQAGGYYKAMSELSTTTDNSAALAALKVKYPRAADIDKAYVDTGLTGAMLDHAEVQTNSQTGDPTVLLAFNSKGQELFAKITKDNINKPVAIFLDGQVISQPTVREAILDGHAVISGGFTVAQVRELARNLNSGAVPLHPILLSTEQVGATLGADVLQAGIRSGLIGIALVAIFLVLFYRVPGIIATLAMGVYVALMITLFKIIPITLTAAGIAAFLLSVGMAVDANILIFERMKEELRGGKNLHDALEHGFERAWTSIRDSNVSSLISSAILFWFGTSMVRGFALSLGLGVLVSMFTAVTISRSLLKAVVIRGHGKMVKALFGTGLN